MVEPIRDGRSFATRRIVARQEGRAVFSLDASFQVREPGLSHQATMPAVTAPEDLRSLREVFEALRERHPERAREWIDPVRPFDVRWTPDPHLELEKTAHPPEQFCWLRLARAIAPSELETFEEVSERALHAALLVYASDHTILDTALRPHWADFEWSRAQVASLDHAMWFHGDVDVSDWILFAQDAPASAAGRGFSRGELYARDGRLLASAMQESLMRLKPEASSGS
jgi:Acyl-CoA thioesterase